MGLWSKGLERAQSGDIKLEEVITNVLAEFFSNQKQVDSYKLVDEKKRIVDIDGHLHLNQDDLDDGKLFFKIGKLTGNLYFHGKQLSPSVIPDEMGGDIIIVPDEEELAKRKGQKGNNDNDRLDMGLLTAQPTQDELYKKLEEVLSEIVYNNYDIDTEELIDLLKKKSEKEGNYQLRLEFDKKKADSRNFICKIYVDDTDKPLKLTAIETAVYLTFMLYEDGIKPDYLTPKFYERIRGIYQKLSGTVQDWSDTSGGVLVKEFDTPTLNGHRSMIRKAIKKHISNKYVVDKFAIEGHKNKPFKVDKATDAIRDQIKSTFEVK